MQAVEVARNQNSPPTFSVASQSGSAGLFGKHRYGETLAWQESPSLWRRVGQNQKGIRKQVKPMGEGSQTAIVEWCHVWFARTANTQWTLRIAAETGKPKKNHSSFIYKSCNLFHTLSFCFFLNGQHHCRSCWQYRLITSPACSRSYSLDGFQDECLALALLLKLRWTNPER